MNADTCIDEREHDQTFVIDQSWLYVVSKVMIFSSKSLVEHNGSVWVRK